jgi:uncharacterized protein YicC (UPF0701 family)
MGIATEMKKLTRNIASSHKDRWRRLDEIREEANEARGEAQSLIMGFEALHQETNQHLRSELARDKAHRKSETKGILREAQDILKGFETSRKKSNVQLRRDLSQGTAAIQSEVREIQVEAQNLIKGFHTSRQNLNSKLRKDLSSSRAKSKSEVGKLLGKAQNLVKNFQTSRREVGSQLRRDLAQSRANMVSDVSQMQSTFRKARGNIRDNLKEARVAWQGLASTIPSKRGGTGIPSKAGVPAAREGIRDLEAEMLAAVKEHPEGINLAGIADSLGVAPVVLGRVSKSLLDKGKIRKYEKLYFPTASK